MQREREVRPPERKVGQERPGLPLSASFLGQEAYVLTSFPETWGISVLGVFARYISQAMLHTVDETLSQILGL